MTPEEERIWRAKQTRYRKPIAPRMSLYGIQSGLLDMMSTVSEVEATIQHDDALLDALDGSEEQAIDIRIAFADLLTKLEDLWNDTENGNVPEYFDLFFPATGTKEFGAYCGYDDYEEDYMPLEGFEPDMAEQEAKKRIMRLTKSELLDTVRDCLKVYQRYIDAKTNYDNLESIVEILCGENGINIRLIRAIEETYEAAALATHDFKYPCGPEWREYEQALAKLPQECWLR